jgi:hypothetical protein
MLEKPSCFLIKKERMTTFQQCILHNLFCVGPSQAMQIMDSIKLLVLQILEHKAHLKAAGQPVAKCAVTGCRQLGLRSGFCSSHWVYYPEVIAQEYASLTVQEWAYIMQQSGAQLPLPPFPQGTCSAHVPIMLQPTPPATPREPTRPVRHVRKYTLRKPPQVAEEKKPAQQQQVSAFKAPQHPVTRCGDAGGRTKQGLACPYRVYGTGNGRCHLHSATLPQAFSQAAPESPPSPVKFTPFSGIPRLNLEAVNRNTTPPILPRRNFSHDD